MPVTEQEVHDAVQYLLDSAQEAAQARADRIFCEEYRKTVKSLVMRENASKAIGAQEAIAYSSKQYIAHLESLRQAVYHDEFYRAKRAGAQMKIEAWRTEQATRRAVTL